jgi:hypothetical protein
MSFGVRPAFRSKQLESQTGVAWYFSGNSLSFKQVDERRIQDINLYNPHVRRTYFQFEFDFHFPRPDPNAGFQGDEVRCAMQVPYTYSKLLSHLNELMLLQQTSVFKLISHSTFHCSLAGLDIPCVKITNPVNYLQSVYSAPFKKPTILVVARQVPCQPYSSYLAHALIT